MPGVLLGEACRLSQLVLIKVEVRQACEAPHGLNRCDQVVPDLGDYGSF